MENTSLHGFEAVVDMRHGALEDNVGGVFEKPALIHSAELAVRGVFGVFDGGHGQKFLAFVGEFELAVVGQLSVDGFDVVLLVGHFHCYFPQSYQKSANIR